MEKAGILQWSLPEPVNQGRKNNATAFIVERGTPGFAGGKKENKLGMRASETAEMIFDNCRIPDVNRLGETGDGFKQAMKVLDGGRISIAALCIRHCKRCLAGFCKILKGTLPV